MLFVFLILVFTSALALAQNRPETPAPDSLRVTKSSSDLTPYPKPEPQVVSEGLLAVNPSDVAEHQFLLSQTDTGLIRLFPRESYDWEMYKVEKKLEMRGGGSFFSFHFRSHPYGYGSDISLERGQIFVGFAGTDYGVITDLGVAPLEQIALDDPKAGFMLNYQPPVRFAEASAEAMKFHRPFEVGGLNYQRRLPAEVNHTYLLRSIVYDRSDVLVALRIARKDDDGSLIIAWKMLKEFPTPKLSRQEVANGTTRNN
jgi:hypothetical protein